MINELIKLATHLDEKGLCKEADYLDVVIKRASGPDERSPEELLHQAKCIADQMLAPIGREGAGGETHEEALPRIEALDTKWRNAWANNEKLSEEMRAEAVAYLDKLKADRGMNPPKYGGYTCPKSIKWLPLGVIWTGDGKVVAKGEGEWR